MKNQFSRGSMAGKWLGFVTAVWVQAIAGNNYTFSNYSNALKLLMHLNQLELNNLSVAKDIGKAFGILAGLASDRLPTSVILLIGSIEGLVGYGVQWLVVSRRVHPLSYWQVCKVRAFPHQNCLNEEKIAFFFHKHFIEQLVGVVSRCASSWPWGETARHG